MTDGGQSKPLVSVIVPTYNRGYFILEALDSIWSQSYRPIEVVVVDDGSTDATQSVLECWNKKCRDREVSFRYVRTENRGAPAARNLGMRLCTGKYLQFLDSDDTLEPEKISCQVDALERSGYALAVCDFAMVRKGDETANMQKMSNTGDLHARMINGWSIFISTPLMTKSVVLGKAWWEESLARSQDMDFMLKVFCLNDCYVYNPEVWSYWHQHAAPRISDIYRWTDFPNFSVMVSLVKFGLSSYTHLSREGRKFLYACIRYRARSLRASLKHQVISSARDAYASSLPLDFRLFLRRVRGKP
jgi:glycosyltransferase involved in cell wall biosynthesis